MVYQVCPEGFKLIGGVCVPTSNEALMRWKSKQRIRGPRQPEPEPEPQPEPEPEPTPEPEPEPAPQPEPEPEPAPQPEPEPEPTPEPQPEPSGGGGSKSITISPLNPLELTNAQIAEILTAAGLAGVTATAGVVRAVRLNGVSIFSTSDGGYIAMNTSTGEGLGDFEMTDLSVLANQEETTALLGEDENGNPTLREDPDFEDVDLDETDALLPDGEEGVEMTCGGSGRRLIGGIDVGCNEESKEYDEADLDADELDQLIEDTIRDNPELTEEEVMAGLTAGDIDILFAATGEALAITGIALYIDKLATDKQTQQDTIQIGKDAGLDPNTPTDVDAIVTTDTANIIRDTTGVDPYQVIPDTEKAIADAAKATGGAIVDAAEATGNFVEDVGKDIGKALNPFNWM